MVAVVLPFAAVAAADSRPAVIVAAVAAADSRPAVIVAAATAAVAAAVVAVDWLYHLACDPVEHRRNEGLGFPFPSSWGRGMRS